jgi:tellurite resistance protein
MDVSIGRDTLIALAAVAWADGTIAPEEARGIRSAAQQLALGPDDQLAIEDALVHRVEVGEVETLRMNRLTRLFTYAVATWIATLDGTVDPREEAALKALGDRLGLSSVARDRARTVSTALGRATTSIEAFNLVQLRSRLSAGLSQIGDD